MHLTFVDGIHSWMNDTLRILEIVEPLPPDTEAPVVPAPPALREIDDPCGTTRPALWIPTPEVDTLALVRDPATGWSQIVQRDRLPVLAPEVELLLHRDAPCPTLDPTETRAYEVTLIDPARRGAAVRDPRSFHALIRRFLHGGLCPREPGGTAVNVLLVAAGACARPTDSPAVVARQEVAEGSSRVAEGPRPRARVTLSSVDVTGLGDPAREAARHELRRNLAALSGCAAASGEAWPTGRVELTLTLSADAPPEPEVAADTTDTEGLAACVAGRAARWSWPEGATGRIAWAVEFGPPTPR